VINSCIASSHHCFHFTRLLFLDFLLDNDCNVCALALIVHDIVHQGSRCGTLGGFFRHPATAMFKSKGKHWFLFLAIYKPSTYVPFSTAASRLQQSLVRRSCNHPKRIFRAILANLKGLSIARALVSTMTFVLDLSG
jgi:hypothetical protein